MEPLTLAAYRHSGRFGLHAPFIAFVVTAALAVPLGLAYAHLTRWIPFIYINILIALAYGWLFGWVTGWLLKRLHARNNLVAVITAAAAGLAGLYFEWSGTAHALIPDAPWVCSPAEIVSLAEFLYEHGSWGLKHGGNITGVMLAVVWATEALIIVGLSISVAHTAISEAPYCETSRRWLDGKRVFDTLESITDPAGIAALKAADIRPLIEAKPRAAGASAFTRLVLKSAPGVTTFCTLRVQNVTIVMEKGKPKETAKDLTGDLVLPQSMMSLIEQFASPALAPAAPSSAG